MQFLTEIKNSLYRLKSRLGAAEGKNCESEDREIENIQTEAEEKKMGGKEKALTRCEAWPKKSNASFLKMLKGKTKKDNVQSQKKRKKEWDRNNI